MSADYPDDLLYSKEHEWARVRSQDGNQSGKKIAQIGVTRFAVEQLGDVTQVELPDEGDTITKDEAFGTVESVKAVSDLFAPVTGKVIKVNSPLNDSPEYVNDDPYDEGWMIEVEMTDPSEADELMSAEQYESFLAEQE
jgi:glycine cleavage system H protein